jgi:putative acetyltransferase
VVVTVSRGIRAEEPADRSAVFRVNVEAFGQEGEARLVDALRGSSAFIPELSLVAVRGGEVTGHILFTRISIRSDGTRASALALAPMAVLPACQRLGIGSALVRHGLAEAARLGHGSVIVVGHPGYYPRFGFTDPARFGIRVPFPVEPGAFMALELTPGALNGVTGEVEYPPEFALADATEPDGS